MEEGIHTDLVGLWDDEGNTMHVAQCSKHVATWCMSFASLFECGTQNSEEWTRCGLTGQKWRGILTSYVLQITSVVQSHVNCATLVKACFTLLAHIEMCNFNHQNILIWTAAIEPDYLTKNIKPSIYKLRSLIEERVVVLACLGTAITIIDWVA